MQAWLPLRRFPLAFNQHVPGPQCEVAQQYCSKGILQRWGWNWRKMKAAKGFRQNTFSFLAVSKSAPHPDMWEAAHPEDPANGPLKSLAMCTETINILSYALGSEKMHRPNRHFFFSFILFVLFQCPLFQKYRFPVLTMDMWKVVSCWLESKRVKVRAILMPLKKEAVIEVSKGFFYKDLLFKNVYFSVVFTWTLSLMPFLSGTNPFWLIIIILI